MPDLQALIKKRGMVKATLTNIKKFTDKFVSDSSQAVNREQLETRIEKLNDAWKEFHEIEYQILLLDDEQSEAEEFEDRFYEIKAILKRLLNARTSSISFNNNDSKSMIENPCDRSTYPVSELRLPRVMIEQFSGDYAKWQSFQDQFETSIHQKDNLSNIHKFQYLKSLLKNDAASLIRHMPLTDANYMLAWDKLKRRYNKKKYAVKELIELFLSQSIVTIDSHKQLRAICDTSDEALRGLQALGPEWQSRDPWLIYILTKKLDISTQQAWANHSNDNDAPTINCLLDFLTERCDALEACASMKRPVSNQQNSRTRVHTVTTNFNSCTMCNTTNHPLFKCFRFKRLNSAGRKQFIDSNHLCQNCLNSSHDFNNCPSQNRCFTCGNNHHTLLHPNNTNTISEHSKHKLSNQNQSSSTYLTTCADSTVNKNASPSSFNKNICSSNNNPASINETTSVNLSTSSQLKSRNSESKPEPINRSQNLETYHSSTTNLNNAGFTDSASAVNTLLSTAVFYIIDDFGITHTARGLLDSGSQTTIISDNCVKRIGLHRRKSYVTINGLASQKAGVTKGEVKITLASRLETNNTVKVRALILSQLTSKLPTTAVDDSNWPIIKKLNLADPTYNVPGIVDIILGNDVFYEILLPEKVKITDHVYAQSTIFGWVLGGKIEESTASSTIFHTTVSNNETEIELLKRFWEVEEINVGSSHNPTEDQCEDHYIRNTTRAHDGRYIVRYPFKVPQEDLGTTYHQAKRRFLALEKKFVSHPQIKRDYVEFMKEYVSLGHMERIDGEYSACSQSHQSYHLPHHCVLKESSSTTKLRVVFDGSCKSTSGRSLNDMLLVGPTIQDDLMKILLRFRNHKIVIAADIEKMYRQITMHAADRNFQRIIWRESSSQELEQFRLTTVTYGTSSAPFLACRTLHQLANDYHELYPDAATRLRSDFYVDDMLTGCDNLAQATKIYEEMTSLLNKGGFKLRKWMTNDHELATLLQQSEQTNALEFEGTSLIKTLGLLWNPQTDCFTFKVMLDHTEKISKRTLLSEASRIFDPLGWLSPSVILIKILFQQLWLRKLDWDDELPDDIKDRWIKMRSTLHNLQKIQIPRFVFTYKNHDMNIQLHGFSDASELAYGATIYLRVQDPAGNIYVNLLAAKTKVAPIKQISIPRLELCAAVLLCRLLNYVQEAIKLDITSICAWTDSQIVLTWLSDIPRR